MEMEIKIFLDFIIKNRIYHSPKSLIWYYKNQLFKDINFKDKKVLDIGGGAGLTSFYAAAAGSNKVDLIEPYGDGSDSLSIKKFNIIKNNLKSISNKVYI